MEISAFLKDVLHQLDERAGEAPRRSAWHADCSVNAFSSPSCLHLTCSAPHLGWSKQSSKQRGFGEWERATLARCESFPGAPSELQRPWGKG